MYKLGFITILFAFNNLFGQNYFELVSSDSLRIYFDVNGKNTRSDFSYLYRTFKVNNLVFPFEGKVKDFYSNDTLAFEGYYRNGLLNGKAKYFDHNGNLFIDASYKDGYREGEWIFYYPNGQIEKRLKYSNGIVLFIDFFNKKGKQLVINGNGSYSGYINFGINPTKVAINGKFENGLMQGDWTIHYYMRSGYETFKQGHFKEGIDNIGNLYKDKSVINIVGSLINENLDVYNVRCMLDKEIRQHIIDRDILLPKYRNQDLEDFIEYLTPIISKEINHPFWCLLSFDISMNGELKSYKSISSEPTVDSSFYKIFNNLDSFSPAIDNSRNTYNSHLFFPIIRQDSSVFIPHSVFWY